MKLNLSQDSKLKFIVKFCFNVTAKSIVSFLKNLRMWYVYHTPYSKLSINSIVSTVLKNFNVPQYNSYLQDHTPQ